MIFNQGRRARYARACPWLSYFAPLALLSYFMFRALALPTYFIFRAFGAADLLHVRAFGAVYLLITGNSIIERPRVFRCTAIVGVPSAGMRINVSLS